MVKCLYLLLTLAVSLLGSAVWVAGEDILTNQSVIEMVAAGLPEDVIIAKIASSQTNFDLSTAGLVKLNQSKVSAAIIKAMMAPKSVPAPVAGAAGVTATDPNDPDAPHDAGIYLYTEKNNVRQMIPLEPTVYSQGKTGGLLKHALTYGIAKVNWKAVVRGPRANLRTTDQRPVFYFYFEEKSAGLSRANSGGTTTPNEFTLLRFEAKKDSRETKVMQMGGIAGGMSSGTDEKAVASFKHTKLRPGVYKVVPDARLEPGEYCFLSSTGVGTFGAGTAGASRLFDFGIIPAE
jgi:hypothetical protein